MSLTSYCKKCSSPLGIFSGSDSSEETHSYICKYCGKEFCSRCASHGDKGGTPTCPYCHKFQYGTGNSSKKGFFW